MADGAPKNFPDLTPEYITYTNAAALRAQIIPIFGISAVVVFVRCYVRTFVLKFFGEDDWSILLSLLFATVTFACYMIEMPLGLGRHAEVVLLDKVRYQELLKVRLIHMICIVTGIGLVKISVSFFLLRLAIKNTYKWLLYGLIAFLVAFTLACDGTLVSYQSSSSTLLQLHGPLLALLLLYLPAAATGNNFPIESYTAHANYTTIFQCIPVSAAWDLELRPPPFGEGDAKCYSMKTFSEIGLFNAIVNIITDFLVALLPVPLIWQLQLTIRARVSLILVFSLGLFAAIAGVVRALKQNEINDWVHDSYGIWNFVELNVGIIAASLPGLKPLFKRFLEAARAITSGQTKGTGFKDANSLGYHRQTEHSYNDVEPCGLKRDRCSVMATPETRKPAATSTWTTGEPRDSDESILPLQDIDGEGILVTRDVRIS